MTLSGDDHFERVATGFSLKAEAYDAFGADHINLTRMRRKVYAHMLRWLRPGDRLLELNAGTGIDAVFFAAQGYAVHAIDIAPGMIEHLAAKIDQSGLHERLTYQIESFTALDKVKAGPFQHVFSNFGGLNCIDDLTLVSGQLQHVLVPGGRVTWVIMPPVCPWEIALLFKGQFKIATRRWQRHGTLARVEDVWFKTYYFTPQQALKALGPDFQLMELEGLSVFAPPADRQSFPRRFPRLYRWLTRIDDALATRPPFNSWGDFFILTAQHTAV
jgi:ubiquinone/menaquinone biosynthesis C-methylase UbiE